MALPFHLSLTTRFPSSFPSPRSLSPALTVAAAAIPPRDRRIDFGKHKGKMLGTLPSTYLRWVSDNLRAGDFEPWANLADRVLNDPVYRDRLEWELADAVLNGSAVPRNGGDDAVSKLLEISERFGWDNEDKVGWKKIDFELLGTSKGGRIPRKSNPSSSSSGGGGGGEGRVERRGNGTFSRKNDKNDGVLGDRRRERRERVREEDKLGILKKSSGNSVNRIDGEDEGIGSGDGDRTAEIRSPFPGREALLKKNLKSSHHARLYLSSCLSS